MKIVLVNTYDRGGAANSCLRLHQGLLNCSENSNVILKYKEKNIRNTHFFKRQVKTPSILKKIKNKIRRILKELKLQKRIEISENEIFLKNRPKGLEAFSFPASDSDITTSQLYKETDILNLHWVANFLDYPSFFEKNVKPIVWTLHDMNPFSGGEHYEEEFLGIDELGFPLKRELSSNELLIANKNLQVKIDAISKVNNLTIVAPSQWLAEKAQKSEVFKNRDVLCIPYGLDSEVYAPRPKDFSRSLLNIPQDKTVILFVADSIDNNRKGFVFLKKVFQYLADTNLVLCAVGEKNINYEKNDNILELGHINDERLMSAVYSAADVFVIPSLMDNLPNTVLESLMCGTPVIGFPVGGIPEMIQDGVNGFLTSEISVNSLAKTLKKFLNNPSIFNNSEISKNALKKYDQKIQSERYIKLFSEILKRQKE